jgi:hypothetical protein
MSEGHDGTRRKLKNPAGECRQGRRHSLQPGLGKAIGDARLKGKPALRGRVAASAIIPTAHSLGATRFGLRGSLSA